VGHGSITTNEDCRRGETRLALAVLAGEMTGAEAA